MDNADEDFKDLGVLKMSWVGNEITIERQTPYGKTILKRNAKRLQPRRELSNAWQALRLIVSDCVFDSDDECTMLESVAFNCGLDRSGNDAVYNLIGIGVKGLFMGKIGGSFAVKMLVSDESNNAAKELYKLAADYFDGKNAQLEFSDAEKQSSAKIFECVRDGKGGVTGITVTDAKGDGFECTKDGFKTINQN